MKNSILFMFISSHFWYNVEIKNCSNLVFEKHGLDLEHCMDNQIFRYWTLCKLNGTIFQTVLWKIKTLNHSSKNWYYRIYKTLLFISFLIKLFFPQLVISITYHLITRRKHRFYKKVTLCWEGEIIVIDWFTT